MGYAERIVVPGIEVWHSTGSAGQQRILPDGCLDLILVGEQLVVAGPDTSARVHHSAEPEYITGVRLHAGRGPVLLGVPAHELRDRTVTLEDVWGTSRARRLGEQVAERPASAPAHNTSVGCSDSFARSPTSTPDIPGRTSPSAGATSTRPIWRARCVLSPG